MKKILNLIPDIPIVNGIIVYITSVIFHRSVLFYFSDTLNAYLLRTKTKAHSLAKFVDKIQAKDHIRETCGDLFVVKTLGFWNESRIIPDCNRWVFKSNDDFRGALIYDDGVITDVKRVCFPSPIRCYSRDDINAALDKFISRRELSAFRVTREACYLGIQQRFFFEEVISSSKDAVVPVDEYKFHIINGEVAFVYVVLDRLGKNQRAIVDEFGQKLDVTWCKPRDRYKFSNVNFVKVSGSFAEMKACALNVAKGFPYVRVDLYDLQRPKVGEITFFHGSGLEPIEPFDFDLSLGRKVLKNVV